MPLSTLLLASAASVLSCLALPNTSTKENSLEPRKMLYLESHTCPQSIQESRHPSEPTTPESFPYRPHRIPRPRQCTIPEPPRRRMDHLLLLPTGRRGLLVLRIYKSRPPKQHLPTNRRNPRQRSRPPPHLPGPNLQPLAQTRPCKYEFGFNKTTPDLPRLQVYIEVSSMAFLTGLSRQANLTISKSALMAISQVETSHNIWSLLNVFNTSPFSDPADTVYPYANQILDTTNAFVVPGSCPKANPVYPNPRQGLPLLAFSKNSTSATGFKGPFCVLGCRQPAAV